MSSDVAMADARLLSEIVETLGPINRDDRDTWSGKRAGRRSNAVLPVRLRVLNAAEQACGPAFTARSRDVCNNGLGLTVPYKLEPLQLFQVEIFTESATWIGPMKLVHSTQTVGGYKVGLQCTAIEKRDAESNETSDPTVCADELENSELTLEQARAEVRQALRRYQLAEATWGLFGMAMQHEIQAILSGFPAPSETRLKLEPRRSDYRHEAEGYVHLLMLTSGGPRLLTAPIADISAGGARILLSSPEQAGACVEQRGPICVPADSPGLWAAVGIWTPQNGTCWLPGRLIHGGSPLFKEKSVGLQFVRSSAFPDPGC